MKIQDERVLIIGDSLSHPGADNGPTITNITPKAVTSSAPGEHLAQRLYEQGASAVRINARVGRSARSFFHHEDGAALVASDRQWQPTKVIVWLGTNDIDYSKSPTGLAMTAEAFAQLADQYRAMGAEVIALGPPTYLKASYNNGTQAILDILRTVFGADRTIDARPATSGSPRASDGVHFNATAAKLASYGLIDAIEAQSAAKPVAPSKKRNLALLWGALGVLGIAGASWAALRIAKHAAGALSGPIDEKLIKRVAQMISYEVPRDIIRQQLIADGYTDDEIFQAHQAAKVYLRRREIPDEEFAEVTTLASPSRTRRDRSRKSSAVGFPFRRSH